MHCTANPWPVLFRAMPGRMQEMGPRQAAAPHWPTEPMVRLMPQGQVRSFHFVIALPALRATVHILVLHLFQYVPPVGAQSWHEGSVVLATSPVKVVGCGATGGPGGRVAARGPRGAVAADAGGGAAARAAPHGHGARLWVRTPHPSCPVVSDLAGKFQVCRLSPRRLRNHRYEARHMQGPHILTLLGLPKSRRLSVFTSCAEVCVTCDDPAWQLGRTMAGANPGSAPANLFEAPRQDAGMPPAGMPTSDARAAEPGPSGICCSLEF